MRDELVRRLARLRDILEEERECLRQKAWDSFPKLIANKLALLTEIREAFEKGRQHDEFVGDPEIRKLAEEVKRINENNGLYIEEMLSFYQGVLSILIPGQYNMQGLNKSFAFCTSGLALRKEA